MAKDQYRDDEELDEEAEASEEEDEELDDEDEACEDDEEFDEDEDEDEDDEGPHPDDYYDYPFAMETENGSVISMTGEMQKQLLEALCKKLTVTEDVLADFLLALDNGDEPEHPELFDRIPDGSEHLAEALGFDAGDEEFTFDGIGFFDSHHGWEIMRLLEFCGFRIDECIREGAHGHDTFGVYFIAK